MMRQSPFFAALLVLSACTVQPGPTLSPASQAGETTTTRVLDEAARQRLLAAQGITLQWIGWSQRGQVFVREEGGVVRLTGSQGDPDGPGRLYLDGTVTEIGSEYFVFDGLVRIADAPDVGRACEQDKTWHFAITQNRPYWRLREFEWCDGLTDYVDIYF